MAYDLNADCFTHSGRSRTIFGPIDRDEQYTENNGYGYQVEWLVRADPPSLKRSTNTGRCVQIPARLFAKADSVSKTAYPKQVSSLKVVCQAPIREASRFEPARHVVTCILISPSCIVNKDS